MSRVGKNPILIPEGVELLVEGQKLSVKGEQGSLSMDLSDNVELQHSKKQIEVKVLNNDKNSKSQWGLTRSLIGNMVKGVNEGFSKILKVKGVGYRASVEPGILQLQLGYSHDIKVGIPEDISVKCAKPTEIQIFGVNKQRVGQFAAEIRALRKPEPYKGKGISYEGEYIRRKEGKKK